MGTSPFVAVVHNVDARSSQIDFASFDRAQVYCRARLEDPNVTRVEVVHDHEMIWWASSLGELRKGVSEDL